MNNQEKKKLLQDTGGRSKVALQACMASGAGIHGKTKQQQVRKDRKACKQSLKKGEW